MSDKKEYRKDGRGGQPLYVLGVKEYERNSETSGPPGTVAGSVSAGTGESARNPKVKTLSGMGTSKRRAAG